MRHSDADVLAVLHTFEQFLIDNYRLHVLLDSGKVAILDPLPGSLIAAWQQSMEAECRPGA